MSGDFSWLQFLAGVLPFALLMAIFLIYLTLNRWQSEVKSNLTRIQQALRRNQARLNVLRNESKAFSSDDPDFYGEQAGKFNQDFVGVELDISGMAARYAETQDTLRDIRAAKSFRQVLNSPQAWYLLNKNCTALAGKVDLLDARIGDLERKQEDLKGFSWQVATGAQSTNRDLQEGVGILDQFDKEGIQSQVLNQTRKTFEKWSQTLSNQVPAIYLSPDENVIKTKAGKDETIRVHRLNQTASREISLLLETARRWRASFDRRNLLLTELTDQAILCEQLMVDLETRPLPVQFSASRQKLDEINQFIRLVSDPAERGKVEKFDFHEGEASRYAQDIRTLGSGLAEISKVYAALVPRISSTDAADAPRHLYSARQLMVELEKFDAGNFTPTDEIRAFREEIERLGPLNQKAALFIKAPKIPESEVLVRLQVLQELMDIFGTMRGRYNELSIQLKKLMDTRRKTLETLDQERKWIKDLMVMAGENSAFRKVAKGELDKLDQKNAQIAQLIGDSKNGLLEQKVNQSRQNSERFHKAAENWIAQLEKDIQGKEQEVTGLIKELRSLAWVDDPLLRAVDNLLQTSANQSKAAGTRVLADLVQRILEIQKNNQQRVETFEQFSNSVMAVMKESSVMEAKREKAVGLMAKLNEIFPENEESWPPTTQRPGSERAIFQGIEQKRGSLRNERYDFKRLAESLSGCSEQYTVIGDHVAQLIKSIQQEQTRYLDLERRLEESKKMWRTVAGNHADKRAVKDGVDQLLNEADKDVKTIIQQYRRGEINAQFALQKYRVACRKLDEAVVEVDNRQLVDINGMVQNKL